MIWALIRANPKTTVYAVLVALASVWLIAHGVLDMRTRSRLETCLTAQEEAGRVSERLKEDLSAAARRTGREANRIDQRARTAERARNEAGDWVGSRAAVVGLLNDLAAGNSDNPTPVDCGETLAGRDPAKYCAE